MRILFIQDNALDESQALIELAAFLKEHGHACTLLLDREERDLLGTARRLSPDLIVVACSMLNHWWARSAIERLASVGAPIVAGGTGPTLYPRVLEGAPLDYIIRGEAETAVMGLLDGDTDAPGLFRWQDGQWVGNAAAPGVRMNAAPVATKDIYYDRYAFMRRFPFKRFLTSRGCHHRCSYCYISALNKVQPRHKGERWTRRKSPAVAVEEVAREKRMGPLTHVHFSDDLFTDDVDWIEEFAQRYRTEVGIPFTCNTSAELVNERVAKALAHAGCYSIGFAVETASTRLRIKVLRKGVTTDHIRTAADHLNRAGVRVATFNMLALPGETPDEALETFRLNAEIGTRFVRLNFAFPMPGTGMAEYAMKQGVLPSDWGDRFIAPDFRYQPGPQFKTPYRTEFQNLFLLARVVAADKRTLPAVRRALKLKTPKPVHNLLSLQGAWNDKLNFRIPVVEGMRFFARVGRPELRATNFPALI